MTYENLIDAKAAAQKAANFIGQTVYLRRVGRCWEVTVDCLPGSKPVTAKNING